jgi:hypothetical protein
MNTQEDWITVQALLAWVWDSPKSLIQVHLEVNLKFKCLGAPLTQENGLLPDTNYSVLTAIEDLPFARTVSITDSLKAIFIPQDYTIMTLKSPLGKKLN